MKKKFNFKVALLILCISAAIGEIHSLKSDALCFLAKTCHDTQNNVSIACADTCQSVEMPYKYQCGKICSTDKQSCKDFHYLGFYFRMKNIQVKDKRIIEYEEMRSNVKKCKTIAQVK